jgi:flavin reductase (DIM6/NTAB) family NADH-FMN oxidoreductase RutF
MAAEWVMQISYSPVLVAIFIHPDSHTIKNIQRTKEFGINVASKGQTTEISVAGGYSGSEIDKLQIKNIFKISKSHKIKTPMISDCTINAECKLVRQEKLGDHVMLVGKVVYMKHDDTKSPLIYHRGRYFGLDSTIEPDRKEIPVGKETLEFFKNIAQERFILKCVGVLVESKNKILVTKWPKTRFETIPLAMPPPGKNQRDCLTRYLKNVKLSVQMGTEPVLKRLVLKNGMDIQRINFILFTGKVIGATNVYSWKPKNDEIISNFI